MPVQRRDLRPDGGGEVRRRLDGGKFPQGEGSAAPGIHTPRDRRCNVASDPATRPNAQRLVSPPLHKRCKSLSCQKAKSYAYSRTSRAQGTISGALLSAATSGIPGTLGAAQREQLQLQ